MTKPDILTKRSEFFNKMTSELDNAYFKHGKEKWSRHEFYGILLEEVDELWETIKRDQSTERLVEEMIQVAAMCLRYYETQ